ncbi:hypothetical protein B7L68_01760 [Thermoproteus sp. CP80]|uniref:hypothetical protein n=1 Tax=Thermoproteus sp. CP80 TaxID=1650659 RepID=UPI0009BF0F50|nr:hypothetical protein [Thermoproteus sp. CP80]PLC66933.1 hypothetical protein B7L68_01760 [Thermoproteus sp. CP80]
MDVIYLVLAALGALEVWIAAYLYRGLKSLQSLVYPILANILWMRTHMYTLVDSLTDMLVARGVISSEEVAALKSLSRPRAPTPEDLDKVEELLSKKPEELSDSDLEEIRRVALALLTWPSQNAAKLAVKLLFFASQIEKGRSSIKLADKVEVSYVAETCTVKLQLHRDGSVEVLEDADIDCVSEKVEALRRLARREGPGDASALSMYKLCRSRNDAGCRALMSRLSPLERKSLDLLVDE